MQVDTGILNDKNVREVANTWFQSENLSSDNINNLQEFTSSFSQQWTTNVSDINKGVMFYEDQEFGLNNTNGMFFEGTMPDEEAGYIFDTDLSEEDVVSSLEKKIDEENLETELNTVNYREYEIYEILDSDGETSYFVYLGQGGFC